MAPSLPSSSRMTTIVKRENQSIKSCEHTHKSGKVSTTFLPELQRDLGLVYEPENWDEVKLASWLCRNLPHPSLTHASKMAFVAGWLTNLLAIDGFSMSRVNLQKFLIRGLLDSRIKRLRKEAVTAAYQSTLFGDGAEHRVGVDSEHPFEFHAMGHAPTRTYDGRFGQFDFRRHFYGVLGDFDSKEEFECACQLDMWAQKGQIQFWVRNLVRKSACSFFLQKATDRFYPDFICKLPDVDGKPGPILAVEYKGANNWDAAKDDRLIGNLWSEMSEGRCRFVMVTDKKWSDIHAQLVTGNTP